MDESKELMDIIKDIINRADNMFDTPKLGPYISKEIAATMLSSSEISEDKLRGKDLHLVAYCVLHRVAVEVLYSGKIHNEEGVLDPDLPGDKLLFIFDEALDYIVKKGLKTSEDVSEHKKRVLEKISNLSNGCI